MALTFNKFGRARYHTQENFGKWANPNQLQGKII